MANYPIPKVRGFKLASTNDVSILKHHDELCMLLLNKSIDKQIGNDEVDINGNQIIRRDRNRNGGGVALHVRSSLNYKVRFDLDPLELEILTVEIAKPKSKPLLVTTWYWPHPNLDQLTSLEVYHEKLDEEGKESIILGDTN